MLRYIFVPTFFMLRVLPIFFSFYVLFKNKPSSPFFLKWKTTGGFLFRHEFGNIRSLG